MLRRWFGNPTPEEFARKVLARLRKAGYDRPLEVDSRLFRLVDREGGGIFNLQNVYAEYCRAGFFSRGRALRRYLSIRAEVSAEPRDIPFPEAAPRLLPVLRDPAMFEAARLQSLADGHSGFEPPPGRPFGETLLLTLVIDSPETMAYLTRSTVDSWGKDFDELLPLALRNLSERTEGGLEPLVPGLYAAQWRDAYDVSRLLLPDVLRGLELRGNPVAAMPAMDTLYVTGSDEPPAVLAALFQVVEKALGEEPRTLSGIPLVRHWPAWEPLRLDPSHPAFSALERIRTLDAVIRYQGQKDLLEALFERREEDVFVASLTATQNPETGHVSSYAVWPDGADTLLPEAHEITFVTGDPEDPQTLATIPWNRVTALCSPLMEPTDYLPPRWRVRTFPDSDLLAQLTSDPD